MSGLSDILSVIVDDDDAEEELDDRGLTSRSQSSVRFELGVDALSVMVASPETLPAPHGRGWSTILTPGVWGARASFMSASSLSAAMDFKKAKKTVEDESADDDLLSAEELRQRVQKYRDIIAELEMERDELMLRIDNDGGEWLERQVTKMRMRPDLMKSTIKSLRVYADSAGLLVNRCSAQFVEDDDDVVEVSEEKWYDYDNVEVDCVRDRVEPVEPSLAAISEDDVFDEMATSITMREDVLHLESLGTPEGSTPHPSLSMFEEDSDDVKRPGDETPMAPKTMTFAEVTAYVDKVKSAFLNPDWKGDSMLFTRGQTIQVRSGRAIVDPLAGPSLVSAGDYYVKLRKKWEGKRPIRILCLDGGGLRTAISSQLLRQIERGANDVPLHRCFDFIAGTSAGSMLGLEIGKMGYSCQRGDDFQDILASKHFTKKRGGLKTVYKLMSDDEVYNTAKFRRDMEEGIFPDGPVPMKGRFEPKGPHCLATAVRTDIVPWRPFVFRTYDFGDEISCFEGSDAATVHEAICASTAAPFMMKPMKIATSRIHQKGEVLGHTLRSKDMTTFMDGGLYNNNPSLTAFFESKKLYGYDKEIIMISLGTGHLPKTFKQHESNGWLATGGKVAHGLFGAREVLNNQLIRQLLVENETYFRFDMTIEKSDNSMASLVPYFRERAKAWLRKYDHKKNQLQALGRFFAKFADDPLREAVPQTVDD